MRFENARNAGQHRFMLRAGKANDDECLIGIGDVEGVSRPAALAAFNRLKSAFRFPERALSLT